MTQARMGSHSVHSESVRTRRRPPGFLRRWAALTLTDPVRMGWMAMGMVDPLLFCGKDVAGRVGEHAEGAPRIGLMGHNTNSAARYGGVNPWGECVPTGRPDGARGTRHGRLLLILLARSLTGFTCCSWINLPRDDESGRKPRINRGFTSDSDRPGRREPNRRIPHTPEATHGHESRR